MQYELIFLKLLTEYWQAARAEWDRSGGNIPKNPLALTPGHPPKEFEEVVLEFLDDYFRRVPEPEPDPIPGMTWPKGPVWVFPPKVVHVPVTIRAKSMPGREFVGLAEIIAQEAYEEDGKAALSRWIKLRDIWLKQGLLIDTAKNLTGLAQAAKPARPPKPEKGADLTLWFDWYHASLAAGYAVILKEIAYETGYHEGTIKQKHILYKKEKGLK